MFVDRFLSLPMKQFDFDPEGISQKLIFVKKKASVLSLMRLLVFFGMVALFVLGVSESPFWFLAFGLAVGAFVELIRRYNYQKDQESIYQALQKLAERTQKRISRNLSGLDTGSEFIEKSHPFASDLDLFGDHSLFQLLNHTTSPNAKKALAERMKSQFRLEETAEIRKAAEELASKPQLIRAVESIGTAFFGEQKPTESWIQWLQTPSSIQPWILILAFLGPIGGICLSISVFLGLIPGVSLGIWVLIGIGVLSLVFNPLKEASERIPSRNQLKIYRYWISILEVQNFNSTVLKEAQSHFLTNEGNASALLDQLDRLGLWVQNRINMLYLPINMLFWTDLALYYKLLVWKKNHGQLISNFPAQLENWEVLISLGAFESELGTNAKVSHLKEFGLKATSLTHPLLNPQKAVSNDFILDQHQQIVLLTGSNMSGKTTFMRTLGINCVLMNLGLKPFATVFEIGSMQLYTSMRNSDNLGESVSSFYAELSRIRTLISRLEAGEKIFFLLDEILKGTNTADRIAGSEALIRQVKKTNSIGIISTHDIELAGLNEQIEGLQNFSFHSEVFDQRIDFDYKIKQGPCPSFNAHKLMELMGIRFEQKT